ncbi:hypothetical protein PABY_24480 [Pyrodictium abyssi]|uniref:Uncharacterized protein n=1 Tax=Pyrodictium abyssi TaxID=54256 RepID=A0ABN6ZW81_9CREN|nr:hypothetical protein PABY_24480 [Pyrodictium abyssi]
MRANYVEEFPGDSQESSIREKLAPAGYAYTPFAPKGGRPAPCLRGLPVGCGSGGYAAFPPQRLQGRGVRCS